MNTPIEPAGWSRADLARIIDPESWTFHDNAVRPYLENRGAENDEAWIYEITWRLGFRAAGEVEGWLVSGIRSPNAASTMRYRFQQSLAKADAIMALAPPSSLDGGEPIGWRMTWDQRLGVQLAHGGSHTVWHHDLLPGMEEEARMRRTEPGVVNVKITPLYDRPALAAAPLPVGEQGAMADRCIGTDTAATTSPSSAGSVAGQGVGP